MRLSVNGVDTAVDQAWQARSLLEFLRQQLDLIGAKNCCDIGVCGSCMVLVDGRPKQACRLQVADLAGRQILTIEGLAAPGGGLHILQQAFIDHGAVQCGICTPGMILSAHGLLLANARPTRDQIRRAISPNLCRCTGYQQIIDAIEAAAAGYPAVAGEGEE